MIVITREHVESLIALLGDSVRQRGFTKAVLGLSGGIDSAVVAVLCKMASLDSLCIIMPSSSSSESSLKDSIALCEAFDIAYETLPIYDFERAFDNNFKRYTLLQKGNFCARIRMNILYHISSREEALVIGTTNKSELMLGYGTIHGDLAHAINPLGNFYKTQVYQIAKLLKIPESIISKAPSADLYEGQSDEGDIGYSYADIDRFLESYIAYSADIAQLNREYPKDMVMSLHKRISSNAFKRKGPYILECIGD